MPFSRLFRSRWAALLWAAGIVWLAVDVADRSSSKEDAPAMNVSDMAALANAGF
jgi:hypothetical protein